MAIRVQLQLDGILISFLILTVNFVWKADEREGESIISLIFAPWRCFNHQWVSGGGVGVENLIQGHLKSHPFPGGILAKAIRMTHSGILHRVDISTFYFYEPLPFQIFVFWKFIKT